MRQMSPNSFQELRRNVSMSDRLVACHDNVLNKIEAFQSKNSEITLDELFKIADIIKDMSEVRKNLAKEHYLLSEHSDKKF